jgi:hypothetical protein
VRAVAARRAAAWIVAAGIVAVAGAAGCAGPPASQRAGLLTLTGTSTVTPTATATATATTPVTRATASRAATPPSPCPPLPKGGLKLNKRFPLPKPPRGSTVSHPSPGAGCAYIVGYADVRKLNGAALVGPGLVNLSVGVRIIVNVPGNYFEEDSAAQLDYRPCHTCQLEHALPPAHATFLAFGFMPVSATLQLTEIGTMNIIGVGTLSTLTTNTAWALMALRISDVAVNGQPLNVGPHCQTVQPLLVKLVGLGTGPEPYSLQGGGPLTGEITIPPFTGCGVTENLDPLFTGTVSGPDNFAKFTQGPLCTLIGDLGCPPRIPKPVR